MTNATTEQADRPKQNTHPGPGLNLLLLAVAHFLHDLPRVICGHRTSASSIIIPFSNGYFWKSIVNDHRRSRVSIEVCFFYLNDELRRANPTLS